MVQFGKYLANLRIKMATYLAKCILNDEMRGGIRDGRGDYKGYSDYYIFCGA